MTRTVAVLGSTGSIGCQTLDVVTALSGRMSVRSLAANTDVDRISEQIRTHRPEVVGMVNPDAARALRERFPGLRVLDGPDCLLELATDGGADIVLNAVVGAAGLQATLAALDAGRVVALANKESCVAGGPLVRRRIDQGAVIVPVDSEHAAVHMCLLGEPPEGIRKVVLTASGGPFRGRDRAQLASVGPSDALAHPTWQMGRKITIDSATLMNKGLEVIEAHVLFGAAYDAIDVVCHPQSVIHCLVGFADGSWKASLSPPDMRVPIAYALGHPARPDWGAETVAWHEMGALSFEPVDLDTFACLALAYEAGRRGGVVPAVLNAANEVAVAAFLDERIGFLAIAEVVEAVMQDTPTVHDADVDLEAVLETDAWARRRAGELVGRKGHSG